MEDFKFELELNEQSAIMICTTMLAATYRQEIDEETARLMFGNTKRLFKLLSPDAKEFVKKVENQVLKDEAMIEKSKKFELDMLARIRENRDNNNGI